MAVRPFKILSMEAAEKDKIKTIYLYMAEKESLAFFVAGPFSIKN